MTIITMSFIHLINEQLKEKKKKFTWNIILTNLNLKLNASQKNSACVQMRIDETMNGPIWEREIHSFASFQLGIVWYVFFHDFLWFWLLSSFVQFIPQSKLGLLPKRNRRNDQKDRRMNKNKMKKMMRSVNIMSAIIPE